MQVFPPGWTEGLSTNALVATEASRICSLRPYSTAFSLQASFFSWQFFSPHQSLLFSYVVSSFYEDRSAVTPPCPPSRAAPGSQRSCRSEEGSQGMEKAMQEEDTKQYHIPSLTVHLPSIRTQEEALASLTAYTHSMERLCLVSCVLYGYCLWLAMLQ